MSIDHTTIFCYVIHATNFFSESLIYSSKSFSNLTSVYN